MLDVGSTEISHLVHDFGAVSRKKRVSENRWPLGTIHVYQSSVLFLKEVTSLINTSESMETPF